MLEKDERIAKTKSLQQEYLTLRSNGQIKESFTVEREYLKLRTELIDEVTEEVKTRKSLNMTDIIHRVKTRVKKPRRETGIRSLDMELVSDKQYGRGYTGGLPLGNFIQVAGSKGAGKSTILMKIFAGLSKVEKVSWFNFEMSDEKAVDTLAHFDSEPKNLNYYEGSREISDIVDEIKFLYADGVRHFVVDSMMKVNAKGYKRGYESFSYISSIFSELTSSLGINIYLINQLSQDSERNGHLMMKHGNDAEYDADYIFFVMKETLEEKDEHGLTQYDESHRLIICTKNRPDHRTFTVKVPKYEILGADPEVVEYEGV